MRRTRCHRCGAAIITGVDDYGIDVILDPTPLSIVGEAWAVIGGRGSWDYTTSKRAGAEAWRRNRHTIGQHHHGRLHTAHDCAGIPAAWTAPPPPPPKARPEECPF